MATAASKQAAVDAPQPFGRPDLAGPRSAVDLALEGDAPDFGGWTTEVASAEAAKRLSAIAHWLDGSEALPADLSQARGAFSTFPDAGAPVVWADPPLQVRRGSGAANAPTEPVLLTAALQDLRSRLADRADEARVKFKVVDVRPLDDGFETGVLFQAYAREAGRGVGQVDNVWRIRWRWSGPGESPPLPVAWSMEPHRQVGLGRGAGTLFEDVTASAMRAVPAYRQQFLQGVARWGDRIGTVDYNSLLGHGGLAIGDANGDGLEDVYVCTTGGLPNRLLLHQADGTVVDGAAAAGVDWLEFSSSALFLDLDNDGDQDLAVGTYPNLLLMENDGKGRFSLRRSMAAVDQAYALSAADFDADGDLDLYLATYGASGPGSTRGSNDDAVIGQAGFPMPYYDANNGGANVLLRNEGDFAFRDVTRDVGLNSNNRRFSFAAGWEDYDRDGDVDLYVANDFGRNNLYRNDGGRFVDVAAEAGVEDVASGMSVDWADYDRDGDADLYVGNMFSSAGNRITYQRRFTSGRDATTTALIQRTARGNSLFANRGDGRFDDVSREAGVTMGRWAWSSIFADLNSDGWEDLLVANGFLTGEDSGDL